MEFILLNTGIIVLLVCLLLLLRKLARYRMLFKQKGLFTAWPIQKVNLDHIDPLFVPNQFGASIQTQVHYIGAGNLEVPGGLSDAETWIMAVLAKKARNIFEFGTCTGKTTYLLAINSPSDAKVTTLTLLPNQLNLYKVGSDDSDDAFKDALAESKFDAFLYTGTSVENKIHQLFLDSKELREGDFYQKMDLIFIDGSHAYSYVLSDTEKALKMIAPGGLILWHDYRGNKVPDVFRALNELAKRLPLVHIKGTSLVAYRSPSAEPAMRYQKSA